MTKLLTSAALAALLSALPSTAGADPSTGSGGLISNIVYSGSGQVYFEQSGPRTPVPSCASGAPSR